MMQKNNHGIPLLEMGMRGPETHKAHFLTFTKAQSTSLLQQVKKVVGSDSSITHLGHAAMVLALLRSYPLLQPDMEAKPSPLYSPCWLNGRRYLLSTAGHPNPTTDYIPLCISFAPILFADLRDLSLSLEAGKEEIKSKLVHASQIATKSYRKISNRKSILPECVVLFENLAKMMGTMRYVVHSRVPIRSTTKGTVIVIKPNRLTAGRVPQDLMPTESEQGIAPGSEVVLFHAEIAKKNMSSKPEVGQDISPEPETEQGTSAKSERNSSSSEDEQDTSPKPGFESISAKKADPVGTSFLFLKEPLWITEANTH